MNSIIAYNTRLDVSSVNITQITVEINIVLACFRTNLLLLSPKREVEAGGHKYSCSFTCVGVAPQKTHSIISHKLLHR